jgi:hypothetical protein
MSRGFKRPRNTFLKPAAAPFPPGKSSGWSSGPAVPPNNGSSGRPSQALATRPSSTPAPDGTGVPMPRTELQGRKGKQPEGTAKTRQVYWGCVFTQHKTDEEGPPVPDHDSTT